MALQVDDVFSTTFQYTRADGTVESIDGSLGTGHDGHGRAIFGEVMNGRDEKGFVVPQFTHRCYEITENLDLRGMSQRGLALDAGQPGTSSGRVEIAPEQMGAALSMLQAPPALLRTGDEVRISHGAADPGRVRGEILTRDATTGSLLVHDPRPETSLSREEGTELPSSRWYDASGEFDQDADQDYIDGDIRTLSMGSLRDWMEAEGRQTAVQAQRLEDEAGYDSAPEGWGQLTDEGMDEMSAEGEPVRPRVVTTVPLDIPEDLRMIADEPGGESYAGLLIELGLGRDGQDRIIVGEVSPSDWTGEMTFGADTSSDVGTSQFLIVGESDLEETFPPVPSSGPASEDQMMLSETRFVTRENLDAALHQLASGDSAEAAALREHLDLSAPQAGARNDEVLSADPQVHRLHDDIDRLTAAVDQWNPHNPAQATRIEKFHSVIGRYNATFDDIARSPEGRDERLGALRASVDRGLDAAGVPRSQSSPEHIARLAAIKATSSPQVATDDPQPEV